MFGFKLVRISKEDKKEAKIYSSVVTDIYELPRDIIANLSSAFILGDMLFTHSLSVQIKRLRSLFDIYHYNKFALPSTYLTLKSFEKDIIDLHMKMVNTQARMKKLMLETQSYQFQLESGLIQYDKETDTRLKKDALFITKDCEQCMDLLISQMKALLIAIQAVIIDERECVVRGVDIISEYKKRKRFIKEGDLFKVTFKMMDKESVLKENTEEEKDNAGSQKCKES